MLESRASADMQDIHPPCLTDALQIGLTDGEARADAADRAVQDLKQQVQQLGGQVEELHTSRAAQAAQLKSLQSSNQVCAFTIQDQQASLQWDLWTSSEWYLMGHCAEHTSVIFCPFRPECLVYDNEFLIRLVNLNTCCSLVLWC